VVYPRPPLARPLSPTHNPASARSIMIGTSQFDTHAPTSFAFTLFLPRHPTSTPPIHPCRKCPPTPSIPSLLYHPHLLPAQTQIHGPVLSPVHELHEHLSSFTNPNPPGPHSLFPLPSTTTTTTHKLMMRRQHVHSGRLTPVHPSPSTTATPNNNNNNRTPHPRPPPRTIHRTEVWPVVLRGDPEEA
jgi:hypothetical protein